VAVRSHLQALQVRLREDVDREGYKRIAETTVDLTVWDRVAEWPRD
jgi:hypothetical protein